MKEKTEFTELDMQRAFMEGFGKGRTWGKKCTRNWLELADEWIDDYRTFMSTKVRPKEPKHIYCKNCGTLLILSVEKVHKTCFDCKYNEHVIHEQKLTTIRKH